MNMLKSVPKTEKTKCTLQKGAFLRLSDRNRILGNGIFPMLNLQGSILQYNSVDWLHSTPEAAISVLETKT